MNIFVTGQATLHWGRLEYGNIGNCYVVDPFFSELRRCFPDSTIITTFQLSEGFCRKYSVKCVAKELYYDFDNASNLEVAKREIINARDIVKKIAKEFITDYVRWVDLCDIFIDLSGDIWGDNADFLGKNRFEVGLLKDKVAQILQKPSYMIAGSPGPFKNEKNIELAKEVYAGFDLVTNREPISTELLLNAGFDCTKTFSLACPSFLAKNDIDKNGVEVLKYSGLLEDDRPIVGFIICGWDFEEAPFDKWPRRDDEYKIFVDVIENLIKKYDFKICLMSHSNGFVVPPEPFEMIHGRDYPIIKQLEYLLIQRKVEIYCLNGIYSPELTRSIIRNFAMLVSGRLHGGVAGLSQGIPTVIVDYGHEPKAHKLRGFARVINQEKYVADPSSYNDLYTKICSCWEKRENVSKELKASLPYVTELAHKNFDLIKEDYEKRIGQRS